MRILIVEDDVAGQFVLKKFLEPLGDVSIAKDGTSAVEEYRTALQNNQRYELVFMDIMLPGLDGQDALKAIRSIEKESGIKPVEATKVIMTTALSDPNNVLSAFNEGHADSYLVKPIEHAKLMQELKKIGIAVDL